LNLGFKNIAGTTIPDLKEEITMRQRFTRRDVLKRSSAVLATTIFASPVKSAAPEPSTITPALIEAARKEGRVSYYTSIDLSLAEKLAKAFEAKFSGISVHVERTGAEFVPHDEALREHTHPLRVHSAPFLRDLVILKQRPALRPIEAMRGIEDFMDREPQEHHLLLNQFHHQPDHPDDENCCPEFHQKAPFRP
jgi:hypothetical protein